MELNHLITKLWQVDTNRFRPQQDYVLDLQGGKSMHDQQDKAEKPLFVSVNRDKFMQIPTYQHFYHLLDNYVAHCGVQESVSAEERQEEMRFIESVTQSECSRIALEFIRQAGWWRGSDHEWVSYLHQLWFTLYRRDSHGRHLLVSLL
jgi:poly(U)-specific endoribonuclease